MDPESSKDLMDVPAPSPRVFFRSLIFPTSMPSTSTRPLLAGVRATDILAAVVFPEPLCPTSPRDLAFQDAEGDIIDCGNDSIVSVSEGTC